MLMIDVMQYAARTSWNDIKYFMGNGSQFQFRLKDFCCKPIESSCKWDSF